MWQHTQLMARRMEQLQAEVDQLARQSLRHENPARADGFPMLSRMMRPEGLDNPMMGNPASSSLHSGMGMGQQRSSLPMRGPADLMSGGPMANNAAHHPIRVDPGRSRVQRREMISPLGRGGGGGPSVPQTYAPSLQQQAKVGMGGSSSGMGNLGINVGATPSTADEMMRRRTMDQLSGVGVANGVSSSSSSSAAGAGQRGQPRAVQLSNGEAAELLLALSPKAEPMSRSASGLSAFGLEGLDKSDPKQPAPPRVTPLPFLRCNTSGLSLSGCLSMINEDDEAAASKAAAAGMGAYSSPK